MPVTYAPAPAHCCPRCDSPSPEMHPAVQRGGEVEICTDDYHLIPTNTDPPHYVEAVYAKRRLKP